jgi:hypothetical protein
MKIKFFTGEYNGPDSSEYSTEIVIIAQGLRKLGIPFYANVYNWKDPIENEYLFKPAPDDYDADVHIYYGVSRFWKNPAALKEVDYSKINILVERNDELMPYWQTAEYTDFRKFDLILIAHYNTNQPYPKYNIRPWQMGYTERIYNYVEKYLDEPQQNTILDTYRVHHNLRHMAVGKLSEGLKDMYPTKQIITEATNAKTVELEGVDKTYWEITGRRHNPAYFQYLNQSLMTYVFGGFYHPKPAGQEFHHKLIRQFYKAKSKLQESLGIDHASNYYIYQWDSYRLWETLLSKSCPLFLDFEDWGFTLPVMPVNGKHYIGVHNFEFDKAIKQIRAMSKEQIQEIAWEGRHWVIENYSPEATAKRLLTYIEQLKKK